VSENLYDGEDSVVSRDNTVEKDRIVWTRMVLKRFLAFVQPTGTSTEGGTAPKRLITGIEISAKAKVLTGKDILSAGGEYALGDIEFTTKMPMYDANSRNVTQADQIVWDGLTYSMKGKVYPVKMGGGTCLYKAVFRRSS
jgi:hypothetical protein